MRVYSRKSWIKRDIPPPKAGMSIANQAFERIVMRIETFLAHISTEDNVEYGLLIHDQCESLVAHHTANMKRYYRVGTFKSKVKHIIETPLFVESSRAGMVQVADLCAYALRRYYDMGDTELFEVIKTKADRIDDRIVGMCHYVPPGKKCLCDLCENRRRFNKA